MLNVPLQRGEATLAGVGLGLQKGKPFEALSKGFEGLTGRKQYQLGDIVRATGFGGDVNEALATITGLGAMAGITNVATKGRIVGEANKGLKALANRKPQIMGDKWITEQGSKGQTVVEGIEDALGNSYNTIYSKVGGVKVDPTKIDDIILNSGLDDATLADIDNLVGGRVDTVEKAKMVVDILRKRTPQSFYLQGGASGKGGVSNVKIRQINTVRAVKDEMSNAINQVDPEAGKQLQQLNTFAHEKVYPTLDKMRSVFGRKEIPNTEGIAPVYKGVFGKAAQRQTIRKSPQLSKDFKNYVTKDYQGDLNNLITNSKQLVKDMGKFRFRQLAKGAALTLATISGGVGLLRGGRQNLNK